MLTEKVDANRNQGLLPGRELKEKTANLLDEIHLPDSSSSCPMFVLCPMQIGHLTPLN